MKSHKLDKLTIAAIGVTAYFFSSIVHEGGHAIAAAAFGQHGIYMTSYDVHYDTGLLLSQDHIVSAMGIIMNLIAAAIFLILFKFSAKYKPSLNYFIWLFGEVNLMVAGGYMFALSFVGFGDVNAIIKDIPSPIMWRLISTFIGFCIMLYALLRGGNTLSKFLDSDPNIRKRNAIILTIIPYFAGSSVDTLAALFAGAGAFLIFCSAAAASFGGTSWMVMIPFYVDNKSSIKSFNGTIKSSAWIAAGIICMLLNFFVLGKGIKIN